MTSKPLTQDTLNKLLDMGFEKALIDKAYTIAVRDKKTILDVCI